MSEDLQVFYCYYIVYAAQHEARDRFGACLYYLPEEIDGESDLLSIQRDLFSKAKKNGEDVTNVVILNFVNLGLRQKPVSALSSQE